MSEKSIVSAKFATFVKGKRIEKKIKVREVLKNSGISRAFLNLVENNKTSPSIDSASRILNGVGESWESFVEYMGAA